MIVGKKKNFSSVFKILLVGLTIRFANTDYQEKMSTCIYVCTYRVPYDTESEDKPCSRDLYGILS